MTTFSRSELAAKALRLPGLYGPDEAIVADDQEDAESVAEGLVDTLAELGISVPNGSVDVVPGAWYIPLANYIGLYLMQSYGAGPPSPDAIAGALAPLYRMSSKPATGSTLEGEYF